MGEAEAGAIMQIHDYDFDGSVGTSCRTRKSFKRRAWSTHRDDQIEDVRERFHLEQFQGFPGATKRI